MTDLDALFRQAERNAKILDGVQRALRAMQLVHGGKIEIEGIRGRLNFDAEIVALNEVVEHLEGKMMGGS